LTKLNIVDFLIKLGFLKNIYFKLRKSKKGYWFGASQLTDINLDSKIPYDMRIIYMVSKWKRKAKKQKYLNNSIKVNNKIYIMGGTRNMELNL
jgi:hypothetical protein